MSLIHFQSARIHASLWHVSSAEDLERLFDQEVTKWLPPRFQSPQNDAERRAFLQSLEDEAEVVALWAHPEEFIGLLVLTQSSKRSDARHLGFLFAKRAWGRGFASELLRGLTRHFSGTGVCLVAGVMTENAASAHVLEKSGFVGQRNGGDWTYTWQSE